jgi:Arc/MetJ-type ribon-helix-helix transcriptional regulator
MRMSRKRPRLICLVLDEETANHLDNMAMRRFTSRSEIMRELIRKGTKILEDEHLKKEIPLEICIALLHHVDVNDKLKSLVRTLLERGYAKVERYENGYVFIIEPVFFAFLKKFNVEHETNYVIEDVYNVLVKLIRVVNANVKANVVIPILP